MNAFLGALSLGVGISISSTAGTAGILGMVCITLGATHFGILFKEMTRD